jgi:hypothetical protein
MKLKNITSQDGKSSEKLMQVSDPQKELGLPEIALML